MDNTIILSKKMTLVRNYNDIPFVHKMTKENATEVIDRTKTILPKTFEFKGIRDLSKDELESLIGNNIITDELISSYDISNFAINKKDNVSVLINEQEHICMQLISQTNTLQQMYNELNLLDNDFIKSGKIAFNDKYGFLTANPLKLGTGLNVYATLFLPAIYTTNKLNDLYSYVNRLGFSIKAINSNNHFSYMYVLSNRYTLGLSEEDIINEFDKLLQKIQNQELEQRSAVKELNDVFFVDKLKRAYGVLKNCELISYFEAVELLQKTKFAHILGLVECNDFDIIKLINSIKNYELESKDKHIQRDVKRAKDIQSNL